MNTRVIIVAAWCFAAGCATSDDPHEGGLFGYLQHGPDGYQERIERRKAEVSDVEAGAAADIRENERLRSQVDVRRQELADQRTNLEDLRAEILELEQSTRPATHAPPESVQALAELERELNSMQTTIRELDSDTTLQIRERRRRINELQKELKLLRERASLLTTL